MQAIQSKYLPATNHKGSRIKAWCERGSVTVPYPHELSGDAVHRSAVDALIAQFVQEDLARFGPNENPWNKPYVTGELPGGTYAHVYLE